MLHINILRDPFALTISNKISPTVTKIIQKDKKMDSIKPKKLKLMKIPLDLDFIQ